MYRETIEFFQALVRENGPLTDFLDSDYTYANEVLARQYGVPDVIGEDFRRVKHADRNRGGVITMSAVLTLTSYPRRTSPVSRGKWVMEEILGTPPKNLHDNLLSLSGFKGLFEDISRSTVV